LGEHNDYVFKDILNKTDEELESLKKKGII